MNRVTPASPPTPWVIEEAPRLEPAVEAGLRTAFAHHAENARWYEAHVDSIHSEYAGKYVAVAGGQVFAGSTPQEADEAVRAALPGAGGGAFRIYIRPRAAG